LNIAFHTKALRRLSESQTLATRKLGKEAAVAFHALLADVDVAYSPEELPLGFIRSDVSPLTFVVPLADDYTAVFESNHNRDREAVANTKMVWSRVNRVKLMEVVKRDG
jgi:hypothetical protein